MSAIWYFSEKVSVDLFFFEYATVNVSLCSAFVVVVVVVVI